MLHRAHHRVGAAGAAQELDGRSVDGEEAHGRAVLRRHVRDGGAVGDGDARDGRSVELDDLVDDALLAQHLGEREREVRGRDARGELAVEPHADDLRGQHEQRLAEHHRLGLDAADAPAHHAEAVDHRRVRVGAHERVGERHRAAAVGARAHHRREALDVHLVNDAHARRHRREVLERALAPLQELVPLAVTVELHLQVQRDGLVGAEVVDLHRVIDDEVHGHERVDALRVAAEAGHGGAHRREVDHHRNAREILQDDARGLERKLHGLRRRGVPAREAADVLVADLEAVAVAQHRLEQHPDRHRQRRDGRGHPGLLQPVEAVDAERPRAGVEGCARTERIERPLAHGAGCLASRPGLRQRTAVTGEIVRAPGAAASAPRPPPPPRAAAPREARPRPRGSGRRRTCARRGSAPG